MWCPPPIEQNGGRNQQATGFQSVSTDFKHLKPFTKYHTIKWNLKFYNSTSIENQLATRETGFNRLKPNESNNNKKNHKKNHRKYLKKKKSQ